ncbi:hypothetical protein OZX74_07675 [Bifidobacterium sp. ESL0798]|uniref:hypothetical protein n=1 Tax=Bifidobacterium sp. ESL0798 TaxID=2983235 RepID=UPI0023F81FAA|nr:hypothetical protein [Bifidobacterium sp. ESL0798]WEV73763.1 hypothetical protein OZX74_07675 [Bifidobacterium sp. ESL0798]
MSNTVVTSQQSPAFPGLLLSLGAISGLPLFQLQPALWSRPVAHTFLVSGSGIAVPRVCGFANVSYLKVNVNLKR